METESQSEGAATEEGAKRVVEQDHERLHAIIRRLQQAANEGPALATAIEEFHGALVEHFSHEEHPHGLLDVLARRAPAEREAFLEILAEHASFLSNVRELLAQARDRSASPAGLAARARMLSRILGDHERRERELLNAVGPARPG
jgi:hypothetical protein